MAKFTLNGYNSYSGCDIVVTARLNKITGTKKELKEKVYTLGSLQTLSVSTHQDKKPVRVIGSVNALDYTMGWELWAPASILCHWPVLALIK